MTIIKSPAKHTKKTTKTPAQSKGLHPRNPHNGRYDFTQLTAALPALSQFTRNNPKGEPTIDFSDPNAVITLNKALLTHHYDVAFWDLPTGYLCPPIPGRADYIHHMADLLATQQAGTQPTGKRVHVLDIGTGANCIYPIIGSQSYGWKFTATDIDPVSVNTAQTICNANANLATHITVKLQPNALKIFDGIITENTFFDFTLCNPPFHASLDEALAANTRKQHKLNKHKTKRNKIQPKQREQKPTKRNTPQLNFGGQQAELWCDGGEIAFLMRMADESHMFAHHVGWFSSLVSKSENIKPLEKHLKKCGATQVRVIPMQHGQKITRIIAWHFHAS